MWERRELKARGKRSFMRNFWAAVAVCFILAFTGAEFGDSVSFIRDFDASRAQTEVEVIHEQTTVSNWDTILKWLDIDPMDGTHPMWATATQSVKPFFDTLTGPASALFAFLDRSGSSGWGGVTLAVLGMAGGVWFSIFVVSVLVVGARRFFLEARVEDHISIAALFTPFHKGNWLNTARAMLLQSVYLILWMFTMVGGFIKMYAYRMVPYILAENPQAGAREAIRLSRQMMHGNKWRCFVIDLTFMIQWTLLPTLGASVLGLILGLSTGHPTLSGSIAGLLTCLLFLFFINGYKAATYAELYVALRAEQLEKQAPLASLFSVPEFGRKPVSGPKEKLAADGVTLYTGPVVFHRARHHKFDYTRKYTLKTLILLFFAFAFAGWVWEVALHIVTQGMFINRGTMFGPWLPIYGAGGALVLLLLKRLFKSPVATFLVSMVLCSVIEYFTSWYLEATKGVRWWDYSGYFMNLNGRICLEGAVVFGLGCCAVVYFAGPLLGGLIDRLSSPVQLVLCAVLVALFTTDAVYSHFHPNAGKGITDYNDWENQPASGAEAYLTEKISVLFASPQGMFRLR